MKVTYVQEDNFLLDSIDYMPNNDYVPNNEFHMMILSVVSSSFVSIYSNAPLNVSKCKDHDSYLLVVCSNT